MDFIKGNYIAGGVFIKDFPYHLQAAGIKVHLLFSAQLGSHSAVNFTVAGQIALMGKIKTKIPYLNGKLFPAVKSIVKKTHKKFVMIALQQRASGRLTVCSAFLQLL